MTTPLLHCVPPPSSAPPMEADDAWAQPPPPEYKEPVNHAATRQILALRTMVATLEKKLSNVPSVRQVIVISQENKTLKMRVKRVEGERDKLAAENAELKRQVAHQKATERKHHENNRHKKESRDQLNYAAFQAAVPHIINATAHMYSMSQLHHHPAVRLPANRWGDEDHAETVESVDS